MPSFAKPHRHLVVALAVGLAALTARATVAQESPAAGLFDDAHDLEMALRKEIGVYRSGTPSMPLIRRARILVGTYEDIARLFPDSGYGDKSLWQGASLAADVFDVFRDGVDRAAAVRLTEALESHYPSSTFVAQAQRRISTLALPPPAHVSPTTGPASPATSRQPADEPESTEPPASPAARPATRNTPPASTSPTLESIQREVLPDVLRISLQLDREVTFHDERLDGPPRVFVDLQNTRTAAALSERPMAFDDDVVRQIRIGRQPDRRVRVVMDLSNAPTHSVYTLYNPFRIVIDFERQQAATVPAVATAPATASHEQAPAPSAAKPAAVVNASTSRAQAPAPNVVKAPAVVATTDASRRQTRSPIVAKAPVVAAPAPTTTSTPSATTGVAPTIASTTAGSPASSSTAAPATTAPATHAGVVAEAATATVTTPISPAATSAKPATASPLTRPAAIADAKAAAPATATGTPAAASTTARREPVISAPPPVARVPGGMSMSRQLGLGVARVVIDPGHGGHDPGAKQDKLTESELVLDVALRLEKILQKEGDIEVILTRRTDVYVPLEERPAIAMREEADLYLSIHANASTDRRASGVETYILNFAPNAQSQAVAARENAGSSRTMRNLPDIVKAIALNNKIDESRALARLVQSSLVEKLSRRNRVVRNLGVKQAPFAVLVGADMPSILAEIAFITNRQEAALVQTPAYRQQIAEALAEGIVRYQKRLKPEQIAAVESSR